MRFGMRRMEIRRLPPALPAKPAPKRQDQDKPDHKAPCVRPIGHAASVHVCGERFDKL